MMRSYTRLFQAEPDDVSADELIDYASVTLLAVGLSDERVAERVTSEWWDRFQAAAAAHPDAALLIPDILTAGLWAAEHWVHHAPEKVRRETTIDRMRCMHAWLTEDMRVGEAPTPTDDEPAA